MNGDAASCRNFRMVTNIGKGCPQRHHLYIPFAAPRIMHSGHGRSILHEVEAVGKLTAQHFIFESNGLSFDLKMPVGSQGHGYVTGRFEAPIDKNPAFEVDAFVVHAERLPPERQ